jgi:hypothetical protein
LLYFFNQRRAAKTTGLRILNVLLDMEPSLNLKFFITLTAWTFQGSVLQTDNMSCGNDTM